MNILILGQCLLNHHNGWCISQVNNDYYQYKLFFFFIFFHSGKQSRISILLEGQRQEVWKEHKKEVLLPCRGHL